MSRVFPFLLMLFIAIGCKETVNEPPPIEPQASVVTAEDIPADTANTGNWTFFRLSDSSIVAPADSNTNNWDLAFRATAIYTNSMSSGPGNGGAIVLTSTEFDTYTTAPESGYAQDTSAAQLAVPTGSGNGWYNYTGPTGTPPNTILPKPGVVLVIRTADGKYAKVEIISYYEGAPETPNGEPARFYTFRYFYQPDGTTNLQ